MTEVNKLKNILATNLNNYYNGDTTKTRKFAQALRSLGLDMDNAQQLQTIIDRGESLIILLGLGDFGVLWKVAETIDYLKGNGNEAQIKKLSTDMAGHIRPVQQ